jgi:hypothetical protein
VGTVDKFQGQETAVITYPTTTSTPEDAPRGMESHYNRNRFNLQLHALTARLLSPLGVWHFYDGRADMEPRMSIGELREDFAFPKIPTASFAANALYLEIIRLAYHLGTALQPNCLEESWHNLTLQKLSYKLFLLPSELTRPQNRPILRLRESPILRNLAHEILGETHRLKPLTPDHRFHVGFRLYRDEWKSRTLNLFTLQLAVTGLSRPSHCTCSTLGGYVNLLKLRFPRQP